MIFFFRPSNWLLVVCCVFLSYPLSFLEFQETIEKICGIIYLGFNKNNSEIIKDQNN